MCNEPPPTPSKGAEFPQTLNVELVVKPRSPKKYSWMLSIAAPFLAFVLGTGAGTLIDYYNYKIKAEEYETLSQQIKDSREAQKIAYVKSFAESQHPGEQIAIIKSLIASFGVTETLRVEEWLRNAHSIKSLLQVKELLSLKGGEAAKSDAELIDKSLQNMKKVSFVDAIGKSYCKGTSTSTRTNIDDIVPNLSNLPIQISGFKIANPIMTDIEIAAFADKVLEYQPSLLVIHYSSFEGERGNGAGMKPFLERLAGQNYIGNILIYTRTQKFDIKEIGLNEDNYILDITTPIIMTEDDNNDTDCFKPESLNMGTLQGHLRRFLYDEVNYTTELIE
ncbi:hypothetical protein [Parasedimentitalea maritima]|uniref:Uncharacterized protein n=1 Tax=Parasedimentitalea maritima TaxID=2578117 RepID=A0A6A4RFV6_9RHOB|nr:hypothetical protein [Zongyanglinia marina]KAE9628322.1 hypothetical protein GP644_16975 [Zongyanglinia marina]